MALNVSRASSSLRARLPATSSILLSPPGYSARCLVAARTYATESAVVSKRQGLAASAKATHKATHVSSAAPKKVGAKVEKQAAGHADPVQEVKPLVKASKGAAKLSRGETALATPTRESTLSQEEQQLKELEAIEQFKKIMRSADPWGQPIRDSLGAPCIPCFVSR